MSTTEPFAKPTADDLPPSDKDVLGFHVMNGWKRQQAGLRAHGLGTEECSSEQSAIKFRHYQSLVDSLHQNGAAATMLRAEYIAAIEQNDRFR